MRNCTIVPQILKNTANIDNIMNMIDSTETLELIN